MTSGVDETLLPTEKDIEDEVNRHTGILKNFKIAKCERQRFAVFGLMFGIISFIYSFMRILKDNYVMSRQDPVCILYIKLIYITPLSFIVVMCINYMLTKRTVSKLFTIFCILFMGIFALLGTFVIFERHIPLDSKGIDSKLESYSFETRGLGFLKYLLLTINEPLATTVYVVAELWGSLILSYLFLSFMNEICTAKQNGRFIPPLFIIANVSLFLSAMVTTVFFKIQEKLTNEQNALFMGSIFFLESFLVLCILYCKYVLETKIITKPIFISDTIKKSKGPKLSTSFKESIKMMAKSKFLLGMCTIICFYSVAYNILETVFKNGIKRAADMKDVDRGKYSGKFNSYDQYITSVSVMFLNLSSFSNYVDTKGWLLVALITPITAFISSFCILGLGSYNSATEDGSLRFLNRMFNGSPAFYSLENYLGAFCLAALKVFKYAAFDVTKERISMRLDPKQRPKFKSVFDGIFNKFGKSMGAVYGILMINFVSEIDFRGMSPVNLAFVGIILASWTFWVFYLGKSYNKSVKADEPIDIDLIELEDSDEKTEEQKLAEIKLPKADEFDAIKSKE